MGLIKDRIFKGVSGAKDLSKISNKQKFQTGMQYFLKAETLRNSEFYNESVKFYLSSLLIENDNFNCYYGLANAYKHMHEYEKAIKTLNKAKKINSKSYELHNELGILYLLCENPHAAMKEFKSAIMIDKNRPDAQIQLAKAHEVLGDTKMALMIYQRIIDFFPSNISAYQNKANLYMSLNMYFEAAVVYKNLMQVNPSFADAYFGLGICFEKLGKITDAIRYLIKFSQLKPNSINSPEVKKHIIKLKKQLTVKPTEMKIVK